MNKYLLFRRFTQISILLLYILANIYGINILMGDLSSSLLFGTIPLSDPYAILQMWSAGASLATTVVVGGVIIFLFYSIFVGRAFCSWVCPVNLITDLANFLRRVLKIDNVSKKQPANRNLRYWILGLSLILSALFGLASFELISPVSITHRFIIFGFTSGIGFSWALLMVIFLFDLFVLKNGWCGYLCPLGGFYSLISKFRIIKVKHNEEKCTLCMKCKVVCPESQVLFMVGKESIPVHSGECTNCARCIEVCQDDALNFSIISLAKKNKES